MICWFKSKFIRLISPLVLSSYTSTSGISFSTKRYSSMTTNRLNHWVEKQSLFDVVYCCCALCSPVDSISTNLWNFSCTCQSSVTPRAEVSKQATAKCSFKRLPPLEVCGVKALLKWWNWVRKASRSKRTRLNEKVTWYPEKESNYYCLLYDVCAGYRPMTTAL